MVSKESCSVETEGAKLRYLLSEVSILIALKFLKMNMKNCQSMKKAAYYRNVTEI